MAGLPASAAILCLIRLAGQVRPSRGDRWRPGSHSLCQVRLFVSCRVLVMNTIGHL